MEPFGGTSAEDYRRYLDQLLAHVSTGISTSVGSLDHRKQIVASFTVIREALLDPRCQIFLPPQQTGSTQCPICLRNCTP